MTASQDPPPLVTAVTYRASTGELWLSLESNPRTGPNVPEVIYARDIRSGHEMYDLQPRLREVLWYLLAASLGVFYARFQNDGCTLALGIAPPDELNNYGLISSGGYLAHVLRSLLDEEEDGQDYADLFRRMTDSDDVEYVGYTMALGRLTKEITREYLTLFNGVLLAESLHMGP